MPGSLLKMPMRQAKHSLDPDSEKGHDTCFEPQPTATGQLDGSHHPDRRRHVEPLRDLLAEQNRSGPQKADPAHQPAPRMREGSSPTVRVPSISVNPNAETTITRQEQSRDQAMGGDARCTRASFALQANQGT